MKTHRIGVLGCANIARRMVIPAIKSIPTLELVAVASRAREKAEKFADFFGCEAVVGYEDLLARQDIDAIYMPLPTGLHLEWGCKALNAGKHLLLEKSLAGCYADAEKLAGLATANQLVLKENYMFEFHSQQKKVQELISTRLGEIRLFRACFGFPPLNQDNFRYSKALGGGALLDAGGYVLKALDVFFPNWEVELKSAMLNYDPSGVDLSGAGMLTIHQNHDKIPVQVAFGFDNFYQCNIDIWGSKARLTTNRTFTAAPGFCPSVYLETPDGRENIECPADNHFVNLLQDFIFSIENKRTNREIKALLRQARLQQQFRDMANQDEC